MLLASEAFKEFLESQITEGKIAKADFEELMAQEEYANRSGYYLD